MADPLRYVAYGPMPIISNNNLLQSHISYNLLVNLKIVHLFSIFFINKGIMQHLVK